MRVDGVALLDGDFCWGGRLRPVGIALGFTASFTFFTLAIAEVIQALALPTTWLQTLVIVALGLFGASLLVPAVGRWRERALSPLTRIVATGQGRDGVGGGMLIGAGLGLLWVPCVGPLWGS